MTRWFRVTKYTKKDKSLQGTRNCDKNNQKGLTKVERKDSIQPIHGKRIDANHRR